MHPEASNLHLATWNMKHMFWFQFVNPDNFPYLLLEFLKLTDILPGIIQKELNHG